MRSAIFLCALEGALGVFLFHTAKMISLDCYCRNETSRYGVAIMRPIHLT